MNTITKPETNGISSKIEKKKSKKIIRESFVEMSRKRILEDRKLQCEYPIYNSNIDFKKWKDTQHKIQMNNLNMIYSKADSLFNGPQLFICYENVNCYYGAYQSKRIYDKLDVVPLTEMEAEDIARANAPNCDRIKYDEINYSIT